MDSELKMGLFDEVNSETKSVDSFRPLPERMRPRSLEDFVGQKHLLQEGMPLRTQIENDRVASMILWGPPGVGKTTLARIVAHATNSMFVSFSAVLSSIKDVKKVMANARQSRKGGQCTIVFVDEIHRFNKAQQDAFLPYVEQGDVVLIGATTENPSFEVISALLSRTKVYVLYALTVEEIVEILCRALSVDQFNLQDVRVDNDILAKIAMFSNGDARVALQTLETAVVSANGMPLDDRSLANVLQRKIQMYDKSGDEHYNLISALHKSIRSSDPDAALYWLARILEGGEDRLYVLRRLVRMASEDIGLADPRALEQAIASVEAFRFLGEPEGDLALAQTTVYLAMAPKSDAVYRALGLVKNDVENSISEPVPLHLRNAPTKLMEETGHGKGYKHAHNFQDAVTDMECLPESFRGRRYYVPTSRGIEERIAKRLDELRNVTRRG